ncbi:LysR family transcriptional regulator [Amphritea sp. HPY]|uniref:LysR family transcriptional regulator n=1 Tax=Amphritea sp. HPY TaxID=3421652 RepID=UPI003D7DCDFC
MNLKQMEAFRAVMLTGSVSQAAKQLFRTQPAVSMMISSLEEEIGFQLFERHKKRLYPTPEADYLYKEIEGIFNRIQDVSQTIQDIQNKQYGFLRIGCMPGPSSFFMPELLADFLEEHPKVQASLQTRTSDLVAEWVASKQYDLGLAEVTQHQSQLAEEDRFTLPCFVAIPADNPLAQHEVLNTELLDDEPMITLHPDHMIFHDLLKQFEASGHRMNVRLQTRFYLPALTFVERGLGVCIMDPISITSYQSYASTGKVVFRRFDPEVFLRIGIFYPDNSPRSMITNAFSEQLRNRLIEIRDNPDAFLGWGL